MTEFEFEQMEERSLTRIDRMRQIYRTVAAKCGEQGATVEEAAIALVFASFDVAEIHAGRGIGAIEWLRNGCDVLEQALLPDGRKQGVH